MKYFNNCKNLDELKSEYRRLAKIHHPDLGGDTAKMQEIISEYQTAFEMLKRQHNATHDAEHQTTETADEFVDIINALLKLSGLEVELCGRWLWIGGDTRTHKDELKTLGCRWCNNKKLWSWHHPEDGVKHSKRTATMDYIRSKYGSELFCGSRPDPLPN